MLKKLINEAFFTLHITTKGPLLIKSGYDTVSGADMMPVVTSRNGQEEIFLPGSSLKGVFRSHLEKIICSLKPQIVCDPFSDANLAQPLHGYLASCGKRFTDKTRSEQERKHFEERTDLVYANCCPTCRLFGSVGFIGRIAISDAYLVSDDLRELRDGVGIDRLTGGASHSAKFNLEVVSTGVDFETDIHLRNFEIWQLGMLFVVLQDMEDELIHIGSGRSRGLGKVTAKISLQGKNGRPGGMNLSVIRYNGEPDNQLWGLGHWFNDGSYGTWQDDLLTLSVAPGREDRGVRSIRVFKEEDALRNLQQLAIEDFIKRMRDWPPPSVRILKPSEKF